MSGPYVPTYRCLVCKVTFRGARLLCTGCATTIPPGKEWQPKTEWGKARKAMRDND